MQRERLGRATRLIPISFCTRPRLISISLWLARPIAIANACNVKSFHRRNFPPSLTALAHCTLRSGRIQGLSR